MMPQLRVTAPHPAPGLQPVPLSEPRAGCADHERVVHEWVRDYLCSPHRDLGRDGPVCPLTRPSVDKNLFWVCYDEHADLDAEELCRLVLDAREQFELLPSGAGAEAVLKSVLIVFPNLTNYAAVDDAQRRLKSSFVDDGLMLGQFYPGCRERGLWNPEFRPLDAPMAMLAIRPMVSNDFPFLDSRPEWIRAYLRRFAPSIPAPIRGRFVDRLALPN